MKKLFSKHSKVDDEARDDEEILDINYRKSSSIPSDSRDDQEEIKMKRSLNKKAMLKNKDSMETEEEFHFKNKKTSGGSVRAHKEKEKVSDKDKLHENDDKPMKKSFSMRTVSLFKSSDQEKDPDSMKSPSLKSVYVGEYEQPDPVEDSDSDDDAAVPKRRGKNEDGYSTTLLRVPSAPGRLASLAPPQLAPRSVSPNGYQQSGTPTEYTRPVSPIAYISPSPRSISPTPYAPPASPHYQSPSPTPYVPRSPTADSFDTNTGMAYGGRKQKVSDETAFGFEYDKRSDYNRDNDVMLTDEGDDGNQKSKGGLFSFGSNKPRKLKS
jgi:hypothetical protein